VDAAQKTYRILVTSSRTYTDWRTVWREIARVIREQAPEDAVIVVVHGDCDRGGDVHTHRWYLAARANGSRPVDEERHPAQGHPTQDFGPWPAAGPRRNRFMVSLGADVCLAFIDLCTRPSCRRPRPHLSHGAAGCADMAEQAGIPTKRFTT
jgi:hypothetical protein